MNSSITSALELLVACVFLAGLLPGLVVGYAAGQRRRRGRFEEHVDQALTVAGDRLATALAGRDPDCGRDLDQDAPSVPLSDEEWERSEELFAGLGDDTPGAA